MSVPFRAADAVRWTGGTLLRGEPGTSFSSVSTDTRELPRGCLFVAIRGPNHDAHAFLDRAVRGGAAGLLVESGCTLPADLPEGLPVVAVADTTAGLGALAAGHRRGFDGPVVAITGSNGKTTTKEMCAAILARRGPCLRNRGNLNNQYGLPRTLLERGREHWALVVEIGMNHRGEIAPLAAIARPTVGVITNVGTAHIEHLGSQEEIALEKGDLVAALGEDAVAVLNADDPRVDAQAARTRARVVRFGRGPTADVRAEDPRPLAGGRFAFVLVVPEGRRAVETTGLGETTVANALAAAAAARAAGAGLDDVAAGLDAFAPPQGRMQPRPLPGGAGLVDDTYNANPQSTAAALATLARLKGAGRALAVLGDMGELGPLAAKAHREVGACAARVGVDLLVALGDHSADVAEGARSEGMDAAGVFEAESHADAARIVRENLRREDWVLVKGSRSMRMERVVEALAGEGS